MASRSHKPVIGLLGGPGAGKSHVARAFASLGCAVIDADALAREALEEPDTVRSLRQWWGEGVITPEGRPDRAAIARVVFGSPSELARLEELVHPRVLSRRRELQEAYQADDAVRAIIDDTPLLLEKGLDEGCDVLVFVDCPREVRLERLHRTRGWDDAELDRREKAQLVLDTKRKRADYVVSSGGDTEVLSQARHVLADILHERA